MAGLRGAASGAIQQPMGLAAQARRLTAVASRCLLCNFGYGWSLLRGQADWVVFLYFTISYVVL